MVEFPVDQTTKLTFQARKSWGKFHLFQEIFQALVSKVRSCFFFSEVLEVYDPRLNSNFLVPTYGLPQVQQRHPSVKFVP